MARSLVTRLVPALALALALSFTSAGCGTDKSTADPDGSTGRDQQGGRDTSGGSDRVVRPDRPATDVTGTTDVATDTTGEDTAPDTTPPADLPPFDGPSGDSGAGTTCTPETSTCGTGLRCCPSCCVAAEATYTCMPADPDGKCPAPDLSVDQARLQARLEIVERSFGQDACEIAEGCIAQPGVRRLLRFDTTTPNTGSIALTMGNPYNDPDNPLFEYSGCHDHFHFRGYAEYQLLDAAGTSILTGRKQAFCLIDFEPWSANPPANPEPFGCGPNQSQGIHAGWADTYYRDLPCQWIDITDVPAGNYTLMVHVNPDRLLIEKSYDNNITTIPVQIGAPTPPDPLATCPSALEDEDRECGWTRAGFDDCTPGAPIAVGCNAAAGCGLGSCQGDPMIRVCDGGVNNGVCTFNEALATSDDACTPLSNGRRNRCPFTTFTCPASGQYVVLTAPFRAGDGLVCNLASNPP